MIFSMPQSEKWVTKTNLQKAETQQNSTPTKQHLLQMTPPPARGLSCLHIHLDTPSLVSNQRSCETLSGIGHESISGTPLHVVPKPGLSLSQLPCWSQWLISASVPALLLFRLSLPLPTSQPCTCCTLEVPRHPHSLLFYSELCSIVSPHKSGSRIPL